MPVPMLVAFLSYLCIYCWLRSEALSCAQTDDLFGLFMAHVALSGGSSAVFMYGLFVV